MTKSLGLRKNYKKCIGQKFNHLTITEEFKFSEHDKTQRIVKCKCDCGNDTWALFSNVTKGHTKSCGCINGHNWKYKDTKLYDRWYNMRERCYNPKHPSYELYNTLGICDEWRDDFDAFAEWSYNNGYNEDLSLDRIDNYKGYSPDNCRWTTWDVQCNNKRKTIRIDYHGTLYTLNELSELTGIKRKTLSHHYYNGTIQKRLEKYDSENK